MCWTGPACQGLEPPTGGLFPGRSAWSVAEVVAVPLGAAALVLGLLAARGAEGAARRRARIAASLGGAAAGLSALSIALPT